LTRGTTYPSFRIAIGNHGAPANGAEGSGRAPARRYAVDVLLHDTQLLRVDVVEARIEVRIVREDVRLAIVDAPRVIVSRYLGKLPIFPHRDRTITLL